MNIWAHSFHLWTVSCTSGPFLAPLCPFLSLLPSTCTHLSSFLPPLGPRSYPGRRRSYPISSGDGRMAVRYSSNASSNLCPQPRNKGGIVGTAVASHCQGLEKDAPNPTHSSHLLRGSGALVPGGYCGSWIMEGSTMEV